MSSRAAPTRAKFAAGESVLILGATGVAGRLGAAIPLAAATLRGSGLEPLDSGFGSNSLDDVNQAVSEMVAEAAKNPFERGKAVPPRAIDSAWNWQADGTRLVFVP